MSTARTVSVTIEQALDMENALNVIAMNIDPTKPGAEELTYHIADALAAIEAGTVSFRKMRAFFQRQHKAKEGEPPPEALVDAVEKAAASVIELPLPEPIGRHEIFSVLRVPMPAMLHKLGPMLQARTPALHLDRGA